MNDCCVIVLGAVAHASAAGFVQVCAGWLAILPLAALAIYGWLHGMFLAIIAGFQMLVSFLFALAWSRSVASSLEMFGCPPTYSLGVAYWLIFVVSVTAIRIGVGDVVPEGVVRCGRLIDHCGGAVFGAAAGAVLGGALLVGWTLTSGPTWMRFSPDGLPFDGGRRVLWTFARWVASSERDAELLVNGDPVLGVGDGVSVCASEPFVDINGNHVHDSGDDAAAPATAEPYRDLDGNGSFTPVLRFRDSNGDGLRAIGLRDCYELADWRRVRCHHAPRITSVDAVVIDEEGPVEEVIYLAQASDVDAGDSVTFSVKPLDGDDIGVTVDPTSGEVTLLEPADFETGKRRHIFVVEATDKSGLTDEKVVTVSVKDKSD